MKAKRERQCSLRDTFSAPQRSVTRSAVVNRVKQTQRYPAKNRSRSTSRQLRYRALTAHLEGEALRVGKSQNTRPARRCYAAPCHAGQVHAVLPLRGTRRSTLLGKIARSTMIATLYNPTSQSPIYAPRDKFQSPPQAASVGIKQRF